jgi:NADPH-dependent 7-cyano-7-deazaguanine reductase QueF
MLFVALSYLEQMCKSIAKTLRDFKSPSLLFVNTNFLKGGVVRISEREYSNIPSGAFISITSTPSKITTYSRPL